MKYPICKLGSILNPGKYFVVSTDKEHLAEVKALEKEMKKEMVSNETYNEFQFKELICQMIVAVIEPNGDIKRGIVEEKLNNDLYKILLMDYGEFVQVRKSNIRVIRNRDFTILEPLAFIVRLYGLIPTKDVFVDGIRKHKACKDWLSDAEIFIQNIFKNNHKVVVQNILIDQRTVYGDLFVRQAPDKKFNSLRKILCKNKFCTFSESAFLRIEGLSEYDKNLDMKKKMEMVEKWQKENFGEERENTNFSPTAVLSINPCVIDADYDCGLFEDKNQPLNNNIATEKSSVETSKKLGSGRGKLKSLIAQLKNKEAFPVGRNPENSPQNSPSVKPGPISLGRGKLLKKYLEMKNSHIKDVEPSVSQTSYSFTKEDSKNTDSDLFSNTVKDQSSNQDYEPMPKVKKVFIKSDQYPELDSSNKPTEVNLSMEDDPLGHTEKLETVNEEPKKVEQNSNITNTLNTPNILHPLEQNKSAETDKEIKAKESNASEGRVEKPEVKRNLNKKKNNQMLREPLKTINSDIGAPFVLFNDAVVEPVRTFQELLIRPSIIKNLEEKGTFSDLSHIQQWAIPAILKQLNVVAIGNNKTGKTLSYLVPLANYVQDYTKYELPPGNGPSVVIVASNSRVSQAIYCTFQALLGYFKLNKMKESKIKIVLAHGNGREKEVWVDLTNGCDVLISTPHCLVRLLEMPILTNFERLTCLVLDEVDVISQNPFRKSVRIILEKAKFATKDRNYQKILIGLKWTPSVENFVKTYVESYTMIIGSFSEAAIFKKLVPTIYLINQHDKMKKVAQLLQNKIKISKTLIVCEMLKKACQLSDFLIKQGISCILVHQNMLVDKIRELCLSWKKKENSVLIATDEVLNSLNTREVQTLIHFELPNKSKTNFYLRYSTLKNFCPGKKNSPKIQDKDQSIDSQSIILIDDENHRQLPHIIDFVTRIGGKIPSKILGKCEEIQHMMEVEKAETPICRNLLAFGHCRNSKHCPQRHVLIKARDSPKELPTSGWVNFVVLKIHDVSCLYAQLIEHVNLDGKTFKFEDHRSEFSTKISVFFKDEKNRRPLGKATIEAFCAVKTDVKGEDVFYRAKVIEYLTFDKHENPLEVNVKLIDEGGIWRLKVTELFELPDDLSNDPPLAVDLWIVGLQPMDFDISWSDSANEFASKLMQQRLEDNQYWSGKIVLALNNTLFLDSIKRKEYLPLMKIHTFDLIVQNEFINKEIAVANNEHLPALFKLCAAADIEVSKKGERKKGDLAMIKPQWAFFDSDFIRVTFLAAENTSTIFLQPAKFNKLLQDLEDDCQKNVPAIKAQKAKTVSVEMFCLALFEDGKWNRGRIELENETQFYVFFIDHGDFLFIPKSDVIPIPENLLLRLPCQAIECSLVGINSEKECSLEVLRKIYSFSNDGKEDLYAYVIEKNEKPSVTGGRKYKVNLLSKKGISLNKMLVDRGMVRVEESEKNYLEDIQVEASDDEEWFDEDEEFEKRGTGKEKETEKGKVTEKVKGKNLEEESEKGKEKDLKEESEKGKGKDLEEESEKGKDTEKESEKGKEKDLKEESEKGKEKDLEEESEKGKEKDLEEESEKGKGKDTEKESEKGKEKDLEEESEKGNEKDLKEESEKGKGKDTEKESEKGKEKDLKKEPEKGKGKDIEKEPEKGKETKNEKGTEEETRKLKGNKKEKKNGKILDDESSENLLMNFTDDVFKDETALDFLKEFASHCLPFLSPVGKPTSKVKEVQKNNIRPPTEKNVEKNDTSEIPEKKAVVEEVQNSVKKNQNDSQNNLILRSRENVLTPQVLWCQNQLEVELKIILANVKDYSLECTVNNFSFRCFLGEFFYSVDFKLFGSINPHMTKITVKTFHVLIILTKLASPLWPRLLADKRKYRWINLDVESLIDKELLVEKIKKAKLEIDLGLKKKGIRSNDIRDYTDSEDSDENKNFSEDSDDLD